MATRTSNAHGWGLKNIFHPPKRKPGRFLKVIALKQFSGLLLNVTTHQTCFLSLTTVTVHCRSCY